MEAYKKGNENGCIHEHQCKHGRPSITEAIGDRSSNKDTDKSTTLTGLEECTLPSCWDSPAMSLNMNAVVFLECGKGNKVSVQEHVERFHDLRKQYVLVTLDTSTCFVNCNSR